MSRGRALQISCTLVICPGCGRRYDVFHPALFAAHFHHRETTSVGYLCQPGRDTLNMTDASRINSALQDARD